MIEQVNENPDRIESVSEYDMIYAKSFSEDFIGTLAVTFPQELIWVYSIHLPLGTKGKGHMVYPGYFFFRNYPEGK